MIDNPVELTNILAEELVLLLLQRLTDAYHSKYS